MNNLTILVVGSGNISQRHIKNLKKISPHTKIILVKRKKSKSELFIKPDLIVDNYKKYPYEKINAVILANPSSFREEIATYFIKKKKPIFFEKPITNKAKQASNIFKLIKSNPNNAIMVGYCFRFLKSLNFFKKILSTEQLGKIRSSQIYFSQYLPLWRKHIKYQDSVSAQRKLGGGILLEMSHELDYIQWIFGNIKKSIGHVYRINDLEMNVANHADLILKTSKDILINIHLDMLSRYPKRNCTVLCEKGTVIWDYNKNLVKWKVDGFREKKKEFSNNEINEMYFDEMKEFLKMVKYKKAKFSCLKSSVEIIKII